MLPTLTVGPFAIPVAPMTILISLWVGLTLAERNAPRYGVNANHLYNLVFIALVAGVVGARLVYVVRYPGIFASSPIGSARPMGRHRGRADRSIDLWPAKENCPLAFARRTHTRVGAPVGGLWFLPPGIWKCIWHADKLALGHRIVGSYSAAYPGL